MHAAKYASFRRSATTWHYLANSDSINVTAEVYNSVIGTTRCVNGSTGSLVRANVLL
jgi:hypothetical protein